MEQERQSIFEKKIKPALLYIGTIGAIFMIVAYIAVVLVMIFGFKVKSFTQSFIFATVNGIVGFVIMQLLKIQGIDFAKSLPMNKPILEEYYNNETKERKFKSINSYWISSIIKDALGKVLTIVLTSCALIYIVIEGSNDYSMLLLAFVNLLMFISFGLISLVKAYDFFNTEHIPYINNQLQQAKHKQSNEISDNSSPVTQIHDEDIVVRESIARVTESHQESTSTLNETGEYK